MPKATVSSASSATGPKPPARASSGWTAVWMPCSGSACRSTLTGSTGLRTSDAGRLCGCRAPAGPLPRPTAIFRHVGPDGGGEPSGPYRTTACAYRRDIAVAGYDGIALGRYTVPRLTTIRQNTTVLAERAADILLRCIEENAPARHETVPFELVEGERITTDPEPVWLGSG